MAVLDDPLVNVDWLAQNINSVRVIDGTWSMPGETQDLTKGYIPGAVFFDVDEIADRSSPMAHMLPDVQTFSEAVSEMGLTSKDTIVAYDRHGVRASVRVWWTFRMFGHENVCVLDGGLPAWVAAGHKVAQTETHYAATYYDPAPARAKVADIETVLNAMDSKVQIVDARPPGRFAGTAPEPRAGLRGGHMPGAVNVPFSKLRTADSHFRPLSEIADMFQDVDLEKPVITSCGSGITAAGLAFNLHRLGARNVAVYDGSWSEYGGRDDVPVVKDK